MSTIKVTLWYQFSSRSHTGFRFNHLEYGHSELSAPIPISPEQEEKWKNQYWRKELTYADNSVLPMRILKSGPHNTVKGNGSSILNDLVGLIKKFINPSKR